MCVPTRASHGLPDELIANETHAWTLGPKNDLIRMRDNALHLSRSSGDLRPDDRPLFALCYQHRGDSVFFEKDGARVEGAGKLFINDVSRGYEFAFRGEGDVSTFVMTHEDLGLELAFVEIASHRLEASGLYNLVRADFARLSDAAGDVADNDDAAGLLAVAMVSLTRALIASTDPENPHARDAIEDTLLETVSLYIREHLNDGFLSAAQIASANHISTRRLGQLWAAAGEDLEVWILRQRLNGARKDADASASPRQRIDEIARRWGFSDPSFFEARYRDEYGAYPGD